MSAVKKGKKTFFKDFFSRKGTYAEVRPSAAEFFKEHKEEIVKFSKESPIRLEVEEYQKDKNKNKKI